jgi:hypothetical protein
VVAGDIVYIDYGAQSRTSPGTQPSSDKPSPLLGVVGAVFLLAGVGLALYVWNLLRKK